jgi:hypothetical protein
LSVDFVFNTPTKSLPKSEKESFPHALQYLIKGPTPTNVVSDRGTNLPNLTNFSPKNLQSPIPNPVPKTLAPLKTPDKHECIGVSISDTVYCASNKIAPRTNNAKPLMEGLEASELGGRVEAVGPTLTVVAVMGWAPV